MSMPASVHHHLNEDGGLLIHSMNVTRNALILNEAWGAGFKKWEVAAAGTFHDIGKMGLLLSTGTLVPRYVRDGDGWKYNTELPPISYTSYSLMTTRRFVGLPYHVEEAICHHDGLYIPENQNRAHKEGTLELILHYSDYYAAHVLETGRGNCFRGLE